MSARVGEGSVANVVERAGLIANVTNLIREYRIDSTVPLCVDSVGSAASYFDSSTLPHGRTSIKLKRYDVSAPLREFFAQFNLIARKPLGKGDKDRRLGIVLKYAQC